MCNRLESAVCYLAGPIDFDPDLGVGYRQRIKELCIEANIKLKFLDPTHKLTGLSKDVGQEQNKIQRYKRNQDWKNLRLFMKRIVKEDLRQVDLSDFLIVMVDTSVHMCGTYHELLTAESQRKPVLVITKGGKDKAPAWLFGIIRHEYMFDSIEQCVAHLEKLNNGWEKLNDKWILFRKELDNL